MVNLDYIYKYTENQMKKDKTVTLYGKTLLNDLNDNVSKHSIALRELMLYGDFDKETKESVFALLSYYGYLCDGDYTNYDCCLQILMDIMPEINWIEGAKFMISPLCCHELDIIEIGISEFLLMNWQDYQVPTDDYDDIVYSHVNEQTNACNKLKHHYKCLHDNSLEWNMENYNYELEVTNKELKTLAFLIRDNGGHLDCFGYAHDVTTAICVEDFIAKKLGLEYFSNDDSELCMIYDNVHDLLKNSFAKYHISLY